jgi:DnaJ-class molecular chaperone
MSSSLYDILHVSKNASEQDIKKAFHQLALKYHPDKNPENPTLAEQTFKEIQQAYQVLSNPESRKMYDLTGSISGSEDMFQTDLNDLFSSLFSNHSTVFTFVPMFSNISPLFQQQQQQYNQPIDIDPIFQMMNFMEPYVDQAKDYFDTKHKEDSFKKKQKHSSSSKKKESKLKEKETNTHSPFFEPIREFDVHIPFEDVYNRKERIITIDIKHYYNPKGEHKTLQKKHTIPLYLESFTIENGGDYDTSFKDIYQSCIFYMHVKKHSIYSIQSYTTGIIQGTLSIPWDKYQKGGTIVFISPSGKEQWSIDIPSFEDRPDDKTITLLECGLYSTTSSTTRGSLQLILQPIKKIQDEVCDKPIVKKEYIWN